MLRPLYQPLAERNNKKRREDKRRDKERQRERGLLVRRGCVHKVQLDERKAYMHVDRAAVWRKSKQNKKKKKKLTRKLRCCLMLSREEGKDTVYLEKRIKE
jgi:hypothetical protein